MNRNDGVSDEIIAAKIRRALLSGPDSITKHATVAEMDVRGEMTVLRPGTNSNTEPGLIYMRNGALMRAFASLVQTRSELREARRRWAARQSS